MEEENLERLNESQLIKPCKFIRENDGSIKIVISQDCNSTIEYPFMVRLDIS